MRYRALLLLSAVGAVAGCDPEAFRYDDRGYVVRTTRHVEDDGENEAVSTIIYVPTYRPAPYYDSFTYYPATRMRYYGHGLYPSRRKWEWARLPGRRRHHRPGPRSVGRVRRGR